MSLSNLVASSPSGMLSLSRARHSAKRYACRGSETPQKLFLQRISACGSAPSSPRRRQVPGCIGSRAAGGSLPLWEPLADHPLAVLRMSNTQMIFFAVVAHGGSAALTRQQLVHAATGNIVQDPGHNRRVHRVARPAVTKSHPHMKTKYYLLLFNCASSLTSPRSAPCSRCSKKLLLYHVSTLAAI